MSFRDIGASVSNAVLQRVGRASARAQEVRGLSADVLESDEAYLVVFDAPGAEGSDVQVRYVDGVVEVRVDRFRPFHEGFDMRFPGRGLALDGEARLPEGAAVDPDAASATLTERGTLEVRLPKRDDADDGPTGSVTLTDDAAEAEEHDGDDAENGDDDA
jgi:HSP20 family protein